MLRRKQRRPRPSEGRLVCKRIPRDKFKSSPRLRDGVRQEGEVFDLRTAAGQGGRACAVNGDGAGRTSTSAAEVLKGMWNSMVSSMKAAVDAVLNGGDGEDDARDRDAMMSPPKKRRSSLSALRSLKKSRGKENKGSPLKRWLASRSLQTPSSCSSAGHLSDITPLMHNISTATLSYTKSSTSGSPCLDSTSLTSFSLSSPLTAAESENSMNYSGWRIRNDALRKYYQVSPEERKEYRAIDTSCTPSLLLDWDANVESNGSDPSNTIIDSNIQTASVRNTDCSISEISIPHGVPPPPPVPAVPPPPPPPPPPIVSIALTVTCNSDVLDSPVHNQIGTSSSVLAGMQRRLRSRIRKKGSQMNEDKKGQECVDIKLKQWAEIQARSRKISMEDFLILAKEKRMEAVKLVQALATSIPTTVPEIKTVCESLLVAAEWFPGGNKEMKSSVAMWSQVERKIELLTEFVQITDAMAALQTPPLYHDIVKQAMWLWDEFEHRHKAWGQVLQSNAQSWRALELPVNNQLLNSTCQYVVNTAIQHGLLVSNEAKRLLQIQSLFTRLPEVLQVKRLLQSSIDILSRATAYLRLEAAFDLKESLAGCVVDCALNFMHLVSVQYAASTKKKNRQTVVEHFEETLKMLQQLKTIAIEMQCIQSTTDGCLFQLGYLEAFPLREELATALYSSCVTLMEHIASASQPIIASQAGFSPSSSREVVLWMMFGCKYVNRVLEMLGTERADEKGISSLLGSLQHLETALPAL